MKKIIVGDSQNMNEIKDNEVDLIITSPYYRNAIDYEKHISKKWYRGRSKYTISEYLKYMNHHFTEAFRVTKFGGYCCVVIANELDTQQKCLQPLPSYFVIMMTKKLKWRLQEEIIWYKITGGKKRFKVTIKNPYPTYYYPNILHENILIFRKGSKTHKKTEKNKLVINDIFKKEIANSVWHIPPVPPKASKHPCPFPEDIPYRLILLYSNFGDFILDNFNGSGTTTKVANYLEREYVGYDIVEQYCEMALKRVNTKLNIRAPLYPIWKKSQVNLKAKYLI